MSEFWGAPVPCDWFCGWFGSIERGAAMPPLVPARDDWRNACSDLSSLSRFDSREKVSAARSVERRSSSVRPAGVDAGGRGWDELGASEDEYGAPERVVLAAEEDPAGIGGGLGLARARSSGGDTVHKRQQAIRPDLSLSLTLAGGFAFYGHVQSSSVSSAHAAERHTN